MYDNAETECLLLNRIDSSLPRSLTWNIAAFANTDGGDIYIGIADDGSIVGVTDPDDVIAKVRELAQSEILPDILPYLHSSVLSMEGKHVVKLSVDEGPFKPYYLKMYGQKSQGVYIRTGFSYSAISEAGIRDMIAESSCDRWENQRCLEQDLSFSSLDAAFKNAGIEKTEFLYRNLKLIGRDGLYTNAALVFSDQSPYMTMIKVYADEDLSVCTNLKVCRGSIISQIDEAFAFLDGQNRQFPVVVGLVSSFEREYPSEALREALLNSFLHRDYSLEGSNMITKFPDRIEFLSRGALPSRLTLDDLFLGASVPVNPDMLGVFRALHYVEGLGFGIRKMQSLSGKNDAYASFRTTEGSFLATLHVRGSGKEKHR